MAMGVVLGAWLMTREGGWPLVWVAAILALIGSVIDLIWGERIGQALAVLTLSVFH